MKWKIGSMTLDILPPVKRYMYAIERRLHTDRKTRVRIMMELAGDFQSRRESGQSDEAIMQEMGTPDEVAAEFNASLGVQGTARVSPWRWAFAALAAVLLLGPLLELLLSRFWFSFSYPSGASGGVIGGADGPTAIYVATSFSLDSLLTLLPWLLGSVGGFLLLGWCRRGPAARCRVPVLLCAVGRGIWAVQLAALVWNLSGLGGAYATVLLPVWVLAGNFLLTFFTHGVWLCLVVLVWACREYARNRRAEGSRKKD